MCKGGHCSIYQSEKKHPNYADYLTKFNITDDTPQQWLDLQTQLLDAIWLQNHPDTWDKDAIQESKLCIKNKQVVTQMTIHHKLTTLMSTNHHQLKCVHLNKTGQ